MSIPIRDIAITGVGLVSCIGPNTDAAWKSVVERRRAMRPFTLCESLLPTDLTGGEAPDPQPDLLPRQPRETRLLRAAIDEARAQSRPMAAPDRTAAVFGTTLHGMRRAGEFLRSADPTALRAFPAAPSLLNALGGLPIGGPVLSNCSACSSGLGAVALGATLLSAGLADVVIAGGYDPVSEYAIGGFGALRLLAHADLRPFCKDRDGMKLSEAYAAIVLERADDAGARGAEVLAIVEAWGESSDSHHLTQPRPDGAGAARAMREALAGTPPSDIGLIAAHATGTPNNDAAEFAALRAVFGGALTRVPAVAFKGQLGHSLGAAGAAELILALRALRGQRVPPTANASRDALEFPDLQLNTGEATPARIHRTLNLSLGFGGANTCVVLASERGAQPRLGAPRPVPRDVVITGVGIVLPGIIGMDALVARLSDPAPLTTGPVREEQYAHLVNTRRVRRLSDYVKMTLAAAADACRDAAITDIHAFMDGGHALLGTMTGSTSFCESYYRELIEKGIDAANPVLFAEGVPNAAAAHLSMALGITGSCQSIIGARTAGLDALGLAWARIASGEWDRAVVSAGEEYHAIINDQLRACGLRDDADPEPFRGGRGSCTGAGAVALIVESADFAARRGAPRRALVDAWAARAGSAGLAERDGVCMVECAWRAIGAPAAAMTSANGNWLDGIEARGVSAACDDPVTVSSPISHFAETLSVTPLAALACLAGSGSLPRLRSRRPDLPEGTRPAPGNEPITDAGILCTDPAGLVSAIRVGVLRAAE